MLRPLNGSTNLRLASSFAHTTHIMIGIIWCCKVSSLPSCSPNRPTSRPALLIGSFYLPAWCWILGCLRYRPHWVRPSLQRRNRHYSTNRLSLLPKPPYIVTIIAMWSAYFTTTHHCCVSPFRLTGLLILMSSTELPMVKYNTLSYQTYTVAIAFSGWGVLKDKEWLQIYKFYVTFH